jgi:hypothetical protein
MITSTLVNQAYLRPVVATPQKPTSPRAQTLDDVARKLGEFKPAANAQTTLPTAQSSQDKSVLRLQKLSTEALAANDKLKKDMKIAKREKVDRVKSAAKAKIQELIKRLELLKKMYGDMPKEMAKQLAALAKEFKQAVKDYAGAAKESGEIITSEREDLIKADMTPEAKAAETKTLDDEGKNLARGDLDFAKYIRGLSNKLKEELQTVKTKGTLTVKGKFEQSDEYKDAEKSIKEIDETNNDFESDVREAMPAGTLLELKV